jgi:hypothetical protein
MAFASHTEDDGIIKKEVSHHKRPYAPFSRHGWLLNQERLLVFWSWRSLVNTTDKNAIENAMQ